MVLYACTVVVGIYSIQNKMEDIGCDMMAYRVKASKIINVWRNILR